MTIRVTSGKATVTVDGLEELVAGLLHRTETAAVRELRAAAQGVARDASSAWYGLQGVDRETGRSGDIVAVESVDVARGEWRVSVGSSDTRRVGKASKPLPVYVHRATRTSIVEVDCTPDEWYALPESLRAPWRQGRGGKIPQRKAHNPRAQDGKKLLPLLVTGPMKARIKAIAERIGKAATDGQ